MSIQFLINRLNSKCKDGVDTVHNLFTENKGSVGGALLLFGVSFFGGVQPMSDAHERQAFDVKKMKSYIVKQMPVIEWTPETVQRWRPYIQKEAEKNNIDPRIPEIIITLESGGDPLAKSWVGAKGLMQIMPSTGADIARRLGVRNYDLDDPKTNITFGTFYIAGRMQRFQDYTDDIAELVRIAAIGYNGGDGRAFNYLKGLSIPNESRIYSDYAHRMWNERNEKLSRAYGEWYKDGHGFVLVDSAKKYRGYVPDQS